MTGRETILANNKTSAKLSWKRKQALQIAQGIWEYLAERGFHLPRSSASVFGKKFKVSDALRSRINSTIAEQTPDLFDLPTEDQVGVYQALAEQRETEIRDDYSKICRTRAERFFTDKETGESFYDEYHELARAYYTLRNASPAVYALFKHKTNDHYLKQLVATACSHHRLDPVWNYKKSRLIRGIWYRFLQSSRIHEQYQPMHLMLTVPHKDGHWQGKNFYGKEFIERFNLMRKYKGWKRLIYGGEYGIEISRTGKDGLHIHMHSLVFQRKEFSRDLANRYIRMVWRKLTGAQVTWYETLYVHRKDEKGRYLMESADGIPVLDKSGPWTDEVSNYSMQTHGIRGKRQKFYLDDREPWFAALSADEKLKHYCEGVMECIKYHIPVDSCFKLPDGTWDIDLMKDLLKHSRNLRMYSKFGAFYREKALNYSRIEKPEAPDPETTLAAEGVSLESDGVEGRIMNPYTAQPAQKGEYVCVLALPEKLLHAKDAGGNYRAGMSNSNHDVFYKIRDSIPLADVLNAVFGQQLEKILIQSDLERLRSHGWTAPRRDPVCV